MSLALAAKNGLFGTCSMPSNGIAIVADLRHVAGEGACRSARAATCARSPRRRPPARSAAPTRGRRRADRAGRTCAGRCSRRGRGGRCRAGSRSPCCAGRCSGSGARSACRSSCPRRRRRGSRPCRASLRWVTWREVPGRRRSSSGWMSASDSAIPGGQPSTTQPIAGPWLSPKVVTRNSVPSVLPDISCASATRAARRGSRPASRGCRP